MAANHELVSVGSSFILAWCDGETSLGKMQLVESNLLLFCLICSLGSKYLVMMHLFVCFITTMAKGIYHVRRYVIMFPQPI